MPENSSAPGVYVEEVPSGIRTIERVATSIAAFVGRAGRGPVMAPTACSSFGDFERHFGGLKADCPMTYAVKDFFEEGGGQALVVRVFREDGGRGVASLEAGGLKLQAASPGSWGNGLRVTIFHPADAAGEADGDLFDIEVGDETSGVNERHQGLTVRADGGARRVDRVLEESSALLRVAQREDGAPDLPPGRPAAADGVAAGGGDGAELAESDLIGTEAGMTGIHALRRAEIFNLLCIPPDSRDGTLPRPVREAAARFCAEARAILIVDPPADWDEEPGNAAEAVAKAQRDPAAAVLPLTHAANAALYFPRLCKRDPLAAGQVAAFAPCGAVAGVIARTDGTRGVWAAPSGIAATLSGIEDLTARLSNADNGVLNPLAVNCLRSFPSIGAVVWGARTLKGVDVLADDYKYLPVRRLALLIEASLSRGTEWVVFEPNDEPLWAQIRASVGDFMMRLFRDGALQGVRAQDAFFVRCGRQTMTQHDIDQGIVNIVVGFAPLKPAEFILLTIRQKTGG